MTITYTITAEIYFLDNSNHVSYGIDVYISTDINRTAIVIASVRDITSKRSEPVSFVQKCNNQQCSPIHLYDAIENLITN